MKIETNTVKVVQGVNINLTTYEARYICSMLGAMTTTQYEEFAGDGDYGDDISTHVGEVSPAYNLYTELDDVLNEND